MGGSLINCIILACVTVKRKKNGLFHFSGVPHNGFKVEVSKGIILHLVDDVRSWLPGDRIVVACTDYSMHQAEEFNLLPCPECKSNQVKIDGMRFFY